MRTKKKKRKKAETLTTPTEFPTNQGNWCGIQSQQTQKDGNKQDQTGQLQWTQLTTQESRNMNLSPPTQYIRPEWV